MMTYEDFKKSIDRLGRVQSISGKSSYRDIKVIGDLVSFVREGKVEEETISIREMYNFYSKVNIEDINTSMAKVYISGRVQSPAVAMIHAVHKDIEEYNKSFAGKVKNFWNERSWSERGNFIAGIFASLLLVLGIIVLIWEGNSGTASDELNYSDFNTECVVNKSSFGVYDEEYLDRVEELRKNQDVVALEQLQELGVVCTLEKGDRGVYIRYLRDGFGVFKSTNKVRPVIIEMSRLSKLKRNNGEAE